MITFLEGKIDSKQPARLVMNVGGIGYEVLIPLSTYDKLAREGESMRILTHHYVREDTQTLFGFATEAERQMFLLLLGISKIGPKIALSVLSGLNARELKRAVVEGDKKRLSSISGIGPKMAERMILELKDKISAGENIARSIEIAPSNVGARKNTQATATAPNVNKIPASFSSRRQVSLSKLTLDEA